MTTTTEKTTAHIRWFVDLTDADRAQIGSKAASLAALTRAGLPVPSGFVVTADAFRDAMDAGGARPTSAARSAGGPASESHTRRAERNRELIVEAGLGATLRREVARAYEGLAESLGDDDGHLRVAVRSSVGGADGDDAPFEGLTTTVVDVSGSDAVERAIVECWASCYDERMLARRATGGLLGEPAVAVVVQHQVEAVASGVAFSSDLSSGSPEHLIIEAAAGPGAAVADGLAKMDTYVVDRTERRELAMCQAGAPRDAQRRDHAGLGLDADGPVRARRVLDAETIADVAALVLRFESHVGAPQKVEFAVDVNRNVYLVQAEPIT